MRYLLDTNVLLRFLLGDHADLSERARRLFADAESGRCTLVLTEVAVAEAVWVLASYYERPREAISQTLGALLEKPGIQFRNLKVTLDALARYANTSCDYIDCHLAASAASEGDGVATFDRDFRRFSDVPVWADGDPGGRGVGKRRTNDRKKG